VVQRGRNPEYRYDKVSFDVWNKNTRPGKKIGHTSMEFTDNNLDMLVWLMAVPSVGAGGFVGPIVPVARTPAGKVWA